uniref:MH2 domain-containing protein n=1 Tax=Panagrolaimus sp. JU765 TaxID=591449 RepID=A0AC34QZK6_9BILA
MLQSIGGKIIAISFGKRGMRRLLEESSTSCYSVPSTSSSTLALSTVTQLTQLSLSDDPKTGPRSCSFTASSNLKKPLPRQKWRSSTESSLASSSGNSSMSSTGCFFSPVELDEFFVAPNADAGEIESFAMIPTISVGSPTKTGFFEKIKTVFRPRINSKSSVQSVKTSCSSQAEDLGDNWIHVSYYEYANRVGEVFKSSSSEVSITGNNEKSSNSGFHLGAMMKSNRDQTVRRIRSTIKDGIRFYNRNGDIFVHCLSDLPVFVQAPLSAHSRGEHPATVYRLAPGHAMSVFPLNVLENLMCEAQKRGPEAILALQRTCTMRVSFGKGWGKDYRLQNVLGVPAWIEVQFVSALADLDELHARHRILDDFSEAELLEETEEETEITQFSSLTVTVKKIFTKKQLPNTFAKKKELSLLLKSRPKKFNSGKT